MGIRPRQFYTHRCFGACNPALAFKAGTTGLIATGTATLWKHAHADDNETTQYPWPTLTIFSSPGCLYILGLSAVLAAYIAYGVRIDICAHLDGVFPQV